MMLSEIATEEAEHRIATLIRYWIKENAVAGDFTVPFTRQQIADMTGLRVETVIRSIKNLEQQRLLSIDEQGKIIWKSRKRQSPP
jgi:CRP-like cAMP-binding protein